MKRNLSFERLLSLVLAGMLCLALAAPAAAAETASTIRMMQNEGTVSVTNSRGRDITLLENLQLYNGYHVTTQTSSYAWLNLDDTKLAKEDAVSEVELRKSGKKLELLVSAGNLYFNVTEPLKSDETLNIRTSTMVTGIRGTCGWVEAVDSGHSQVYVLEGRLDCRVTDPTTGQSKSASVQGGERADFYVYDQGLPGERCEIVTGAFSEDDVNGFVLMELAGDEGLCDRIYAGSGLDLRTRAASARARLAADEAAMAQAMDQSRSLAAGQASSVSKNPVWTGGSGGGNAVQQSASASAGELSAQLADPGVEEIVIAGDPGVPETMVVDSELDVPAGKTLTLGRDVNVEIQPGAVVVVAGTLHTQGDLTNYGTIDVTSGRTLRVEGQLVNGKDGVIRNHGEGRIVAAEGILNSGMIINADQAEITSEAVATVRQQAGGTLQLAGGSISNGGGGYAFLKEGTLTPAEAKALAANQGGSIRAKTTNVFGSVDESGVYSTVRPEGWSAHIQGSGYYQVQEGSDGSDGGVTTVVETRTNTVYETETVYETIYETIYEPVYVDGEAAEITFDQNLDYKLGDNYYISSWNTAPDGSGTDLTQLGTVSGSLTVYAQWTATGGSGDPSEKPTYTIRYNDNLENKGGEDYQISSWNTEADGSGTRLEQLTSISEDITVYAQWAKTSGDSGNSYTVTFDANNGAEYNGSGEAPTRTGYTFLGWNTEQDGSGSWLTGNVTVADNKLTYYAQWRQEKAASDPLLTFNLNGGTWGAGGTPQKAGYTFTGWSTDAAGNSMLGGTAGYTVTGNTILYAQWKQESGTSYKVTFNTGGGTWDAGLMTRSNNEVFAGWYTDEQYTTKVSNVLHVSGDTTFYAKWVPVLPDETGPFIVTGGELDVDYENSVGSYGDNRALIVKTDTPLVIKNTDPSTDIMGCIVIEAENADITLAGVKLQGQGASAIFMTDGPKELHLTLQAGTENILKSPASCAGVQVKSNQSLVICGGGTLNATGGANAAGIGGGATQSSGKITINGGTVTATGGGYGAGIGGGNGGNGCNITMTNGNVTAIGGTNAAGIGGGNWKNASNISISGGDVTATGGIDGAGIGSGYNESGKADYIAISGGIVKATGKGGGAGIGGGHMNGASDITISGGDVTAIGGTSRGGAGIGGGSKGSTQNITISGGIVKATGGSNDGGGDYGAGIGGGTRGNASDITICGGNVTATGRSGAGIGGGNYGNGTKITIAGGNITAVSQSGGAGIGGGRMGNASNIYLIAGSGEITGNVEKGENTNGLAVGCGKLGTASDFDTIKVIGFTKSNG